MKTGVPPLVHGRTKEALAVGRRSAYGCEVSLTRNGNLEVSLRTGICRVSVLRV